MVRYCEVCKKPICPIRMEALPDTKTCKDCSSEKKRVGFMTSEFSKGTGSTLVTVDPDDEESLRIAKRANDRSR